MLAFNSISHLWWSYLGPISNTWIYMYDHNTSSHDLIRKPIKLKYFFNQLSGNNGQCKCDWKILWKLKIKDNTGFDMESAHPKCKTCARILILHVYTRGYLYQMKSKCPTWRYLCTVCPGFLVLSSKGSSEFLSNPVSSFCITNHEKCDQYQLGH